MAFEDIKNTKIEQAEANTLSGADVLTSNDATASTLTVAQLGKMDAVAMVDPRTSDAVMQGREVAVQQALASKDPEHLKAVQAMVTGHLNSMTAHVENITAKLAAAEAANNQTA